MGLTIITKNLSLKLQKIKTDCLDSIAKLTKIVLS